MIYRVIIHHQQVKKYDASLNGSSWKKDHVYIHYLRNDASSYKSWHVWAWQKAPKNLAGTKYDWEEGRDIAGAYVSIDLKSDKYVGAIQIGYLIVLSSSLGGSGHWTSDSGGDVIFKLDREDIPSRPNGKIYVFATYDGDSWLGIYMEPVSYIIIKLHKTQPNYWLGFYLEQMIKVINI